MVYGLFIVGDPLEYLGMVCLPSLRPKPDVAYKLIKVHIVCLGVREDVKVANVADIPLSSLGLRS